MIDSGARRRGAIVLGLAVLALGIAPGCSKEEEHVPDPKGNPIPEVKGPGGGGPKMPSLEERVFGAKGCSNCHTTDGSGRKKGPDLAKVGADPAHTRQWFVNKIRNPQADMPDSKMPANDESKVNDQEMDQLVRYLRSLK